MNKKTIATGVVVALIALIVFSIYLWNKEVEKDNEGLAAHQEKKSEQEKKAKKERDEETATYSDLAQRLYNGEVTRINLIGDSITAGVGIPSHSVPDDGKVIFENDDELFRESNHSAESWANDFRGYINNNFTGIDFINSGIGGKSAEWAVENQERWLTNEEDVVFVMLGTNDRASGDLGALRNNLESFLEYVDSVSNTMIVMSPPFSSTDTEFDFGAAEINRIVSEIANDNDYTFISHYNLFNDIVEDEDIEMTDLTHPEGSHPLERGYHEMWNHIKSELDLDKITD